MGGQNRTSCFAVLLTIAVSFGAAPARAKVTTNEKPSSQNARPINETNWQQHPDIRAIRAIVRSINAGLKTHRFRVAERKFESCGDSFFTLRRIARNAKESAVWYEDYSEGEDASWDYFQYYDDSHRLRFAFIVVYAANSSRDQHRAYFDENGKLIWHSRRSIKGPGYFTPPDIENLAKQDPEKEYTLHEGCVEMKPAKKNSNKATQN